MADSNEKLNDQMDKLAQIAAQQRTIRRTVTPQPFNDPRQSFGAEIQTSYSPVPKKETLKFGDSESETGVSIYGKVVFSGGIIPKIKILHPEKIQIGQMTSHYTSIELSDIDDIKKLHSVCEQVITHYAAELVKKELRHQESIKGLSEDQVPTVGMANRAFTPKPLPPEVAKKIMGDLSSIDVLDDSGRNHFIETIKQYLPWK